LTQGEKTQATIYFKARSAALDAKDRRVLRELIASLPSGAKISTLVMGYAGPNAGAGAQGISLRRANNALEYLVAEGLKGDTYASGKGKSKATGGKGRKVVVKVTYVLNSRSVDLDGAELKAALYR